MIIGERGGTRFCFWGWSSSLQRLRTCRNSLVLYRVQNHNMFLRFDRKFSGLWAGFTLYFQNGTVKNMRMHVFLIIRIYMLLWFERRMQNNCPRIFQVCWWLVLFSSVFIVKTILVWIRAKQCYARRQFSCERRLDFEQCIAIIW